MNWKVLLKTSVFWQKIVSCIDKYGGLKAAYQAILCCMLETLNSNFACGNRSIYVILLPIGPQQSLLMIIKWIWDLNLFASSLKASTSNFRTCFVGSLVFNLRFKKFPNHRLFFWFGRKSRQHQQMTNMNWFDTLTDLVFRQTRRNCSWSKLKILVLFRKPRAFPH